MDLHLACRQMSLPGLLTPIGQALNGDDELTAELFCLGKHLFRKIAGVKTI